MPLINGSRLQSNAFEPEPRLNNMVENTSSFWKKSELPFPHLKDVLQQYCIEYTWQKKRKHILYMESYLIATERLLAIT